MNNYILLVLLISLPTSNSFCESVWRYNSSYSYHEQVTEQHVISEPDNALTSLLFCIFGIWGLMSNKQKTIYYIVNYLFIMTGISSYLHHYYYSNNTWAYAADIINVQLLCSFSAYYMLCNILFAKTKNIVIQKYIIIQKIAGFIIVFNCEIMIIFYNIGYGPRNELLQFTISLIILVQTYFTYNILKNRIIYYKIKYNVLKNQLFNLVIFTLACILWYLDIECYEWMHYTFNAHAFWHIFSSWSLFNVINISNLYLSIENNLVFNWKTPFQITECIILKIEITSTRIDLNNRATTMSPEHIILLDNSKYRHRRVQSHG